MFRNGTEKQGDILPPKGYEKTAKHIMRVYKEDVLRLINNETGEVEYKLVKGISPALQAFDLRPLTVAQMGQKFESINTIFAKYTMKRCYALPTGRYIPMKYQCGLKGKK